MTAQPTKRLQMSLVSRCGVIVVVVVPCLFAACVERYSRSATIQVLSSSICTKGASCNFIEAGDTVEACTDRVEAELDKSLDKDAVSKCSKDEVDECRKQIEAASTDCFEVFISKKLPSACDGC